MATWILNISKSGDSITCTSTVTPTVQKCFLMFSQNILCFSLCQLSFLVPGHHLNEPDSIIPTFSFHVCIVIDEAPLSLLFSSLNSPRCLSLFSQQRCSLKPWSPALDPVQYIHISLVPRSPEIDTVLQMRHHQNWIEGKDHLLNLLGEHFGRSPPKKYLELKT